MLPPKLAGEVRNHVGNVNGRLDLAQGRIGNVEVRRAKNCGAILNIGSIREVVVARAVMPTGKTVLIYPPKFLQRTRLTVGQTPEDEKYFFRTKYVEVTSCFV